MLVKDAIICKQSHFSSKQRQLAKFILDNIKSVSLMNSMELAEASGVSNPTVIRFVTFIGFDGYISFQKELHKNIFNYFTSEDQARHIAANEKPDDCMNELDFLVEKIPSFMKKRDRRVITCAAELISKCEDIYFIGNQISSVFLEYCKYDFSKYIKNTHIINNGNLEYYDVIHGNPDKKCAVVFALQRYPNRTLGIVKDMYAAKIPMIIFTDSDIFPYSHMAEYIICTPAESASFVNPIINTFILIMDLQRQVIKLNEKVALENVKRFEAFELENNIYYKIPATKKSSKEL